MGHEGWLTLRGQAGVLGATTGHVAVHVGVGDGGTVAARSKLVGCQASPDLRPIAFGLLVVGFAALCEQGYAA